MICKIIDPFFDHLKNFRNVGSNLELRKHWAYVSERLFHIRSGNKIVEIEKLIKMNISTKRIELLYGLFCISIFVSIGRCIVYVYHMLNKQSFIELGIVILEDTYDQFNHAKTYILESLIRTGVLYIGK